MKYLKYILGLSAVLLIVFLLLGMINPKLSYDSEIVVEKPAAESWAVVQDEAKMAEWLTGFQKVEHISGTPGTVGAVSLVYFDNEGQQMSIQETITNIVPDESISMVFEDDFMDMDYKMSLTSIDGKTKINSNTTVVGNSMFSKSILVFIRGSLKAQEDANLIKLKQAIEQNTNDYFPLDDELVEIKEGENK